MNFSDLDTTVAWLKVTYPDSSCQILRATRSLEIIEFYCEKLDCRDVYDVNNKTLKEGYIFDVKNKQIRELNVENCSIEVSKKKPTFDREVDRFASSFIR